MGIDLDSIADVMGVTAAVTGAGAGALAALGDDEPEPASTTVDIGALLVGGMVGYAAAQAADVPPLAGAGVGALLATLLRPQLGL